MLGWLYKYNGKENGNYYNVIGVILIGIGAASSGMSLHMQSHEVHLVAFQGGPQYRPPNSIVLIMGTPKKVPPNFGKPPFNTFTD